MLVRIYKVIVLLQNAKERNTNQFQVSAGFYIETSHLIFHCSAGLRRFFFLYQHLHIKQNITITRPTCICCNIPGTKKNPYKI